MSTNDDQGRVTLELTDQVAHIRFDRPAARNAMTWAMYEGLAAACERIAENPELRVAVLRGAGGKAFVAGTDIAQFKDFTSGEDGIAYETRIDGFVDALQRLPIPTVAVVEGYAVGGGLAIANACDLRIATADARFGVPIARTLGNCLSAKNVRRLVATLGIGWVKRMLLLAEMPTAAELQPTGYLAATVQQEALDATVQEIVARLLSHAPITMAVTRETLRRLETDPAADISDLIRRTYGSEDFHAGVAGFTSKAAVAWRGV
ncbi:MAG: crt [Rhodospirillales bacterium]|nr:crt [Rhodospirillales bacterium]